MKQPFVIHLLITIILISNCLQTSFSARSSDASLSSEAREVRFWSHSFGKEIKDGSTESTCMRQVSENYERMKAKVERVDAAQMLEQMKIDVTNMLKWKKEAVQKIALEAEKLASNHTFDKYLKFHYINAKKINDSSLISHYDPIRKERWIRNVTSQGRTVLHLEKHTNFDPPVNLLHSAIHVPVNVYDEAMHLVNHVKWSEGLTQTFKNNLALDPGLSWQFFASDTGFLRTYPAAKWRIPQYVKDGGNHGGNKGGHDVDSGLDLYDARFRGWYIRAAASPKDMLILLDGSGSMTGQRKEIAKQVVLNILETLTDDDFVNVVRFSESIEPVVECFGMDKLVQANKQNVREFRERLDTLNTSDIANFTLALSHAFETLNGLFQNKEPSSALCNQAIMLVTDGAPDTYESIFSQYNWPRINIRVFTYLVGREVIETREVNWMACHNRGYYTHVANLAEVREQVQMYVPVMARPLVLTGDAFRPYTWTPVYADVTDIPLTNWAWEERQKEKIRAAIRAKIEQRFQADGSFPQPSEDKEAAAGSNNNEDEGIDPEEKEYEDYVEELERNKTRKSRDTRSKKGSKGSLDSARDRTDVSLKNDVVHPSPDENDFDTFYRPLPYTSNGDMVPVAPKEKKKKGVTLMTTISTPVYDQKNTTNITVRILVKNLWEEREETIRTANLLGVAGIDVPIKEIVKLTPAYKLGVNGYSFAITNNGYLLYHPDLRPIFQDMLKPYYSSVDLTEVELPDNDKTIDEKDEKLDGMKKDMIDRKIGWKSLDVKIHLDSLRRVTTRTNSYHYGPIEDTPFSLAISLPEPYGKYRVDGQIEVKRRDEDYTQYFKGRNWRVHPDWLYCDQPTNTVAGMVPSSPEEVIRLFLDQAKQSASNVRWRASSTRPPVYDRLSCEKDLVQSLVFDAKATNIDPKRCSPPKSPNKYEREITKLYGIVMTFATTRSGLTRFEDHRSDQEKANSSLLIASASVLGGADRSFTDVHVKATDELFYKRAVDYNRINGSSFVYSVPSDAATRSPDNVYVTASNAIFVGSSKQRAPAAVIGLVYKHSMFKERFFNSTKMCGERKCKVRCTDETTDCFLVDNNGFIIVSKDDSFTGKILSEYDAALLELLVDQKVFIRKKIYDYQAICIDFYQVSGPGNMLLTPFKLAATLMTHIWSQLSLLAIDMYLNPWSINLNTVFGANVEDDNDPNIITDNGEGDEEEEEDEDYEDGEYPDFEPDESKKFINKTRPRPCIKEIDLYDLNQNFVNSDSPSSGKHNKCPGDCNAEYIAQSVPYTNLISLVVLNKCSTCSYDTKKLEALPVQPEQECSLVNREKYRRRPEKCISQHPEEATIKICGAGFTIKSSPVIVLLISLIWSFKLFTLSWS